MPCTFKYKYCKTCDHQWFEGLHRYPCSGHLFYGVECEKCEGRKKVEKDEEATEKHKKEDFGDADTVCGK